MKNIEKLKLMEARLEKLKESPKCIKAPGVIKALTREVRNMKEKVANE